MENTTTYIQLQAPPWVTADHIKKAVPMMNKVMEMIGDSEEAMRGYISGANMAGFPVKPGFATRAQLHEITMRAFWWTFEKITAERAAKL